MDELQTTLSARGLSVSTLPNKGRCLFATRDFRPGEIVVSEKPYVWAPNKSGGESRCDGCFGTSNLKKCSACQVAWYCGSSCQKEEWKLHRPECAALSKLHKDRRKSVTPSIRLVLRLYLRRKLEAEGVIPATAMENYKLVEALVSHMSDIEEKQLVLYAQMANLVNLILQLPDMNIKEIAENFSKLACNAHTICDSELRPLGNGLFPVVSIINHSCLPNSVLVFEGKSAVVRAVQLISKDSEVLISYIETAGSTMTRQKALKEQYFFTCKCLRCIKVGQCDDIQESAILEGYHCKNNRCDGLLFRDADNIGFICQLCGLVRSKDEIKAMASEIKSLSDKATPTSPQKNQEAISMYKKIEELQRKLCHQFSISLMQTREKLLKLFMKLQDWSEALAYCRLTIPVYEIGNRKFLEKNAGNLGWWFLSFIRSKILIFLCHKNGVGKMTQEDTAKLILIESTHLFRDRHKWLLGDTKNAVESLTKAVDILRITHGTTSPFIKELFLKLDEARAEASYKLSSKQDE